MQLIQSSFHGQELEGSYDGRTPGTNYNYNPFRFIQKFMPPGLDETERMGRGFFWFKTEKTRDWYKAQVSTITMWDDEGLREHHLVPMERAPPKVRNPGAAQAPRGAEAEAEAKVVEEEVTSEVISEANRFKGKQSSFFGAQPLSQQTSTV
jgi:hypothetical protein